MNYDPQTFRKRVCRRYHIRPVGRDERPSVNGLEKAGLEPIKFLAAGILLRAGSDWMRTRKRPEYSHWLAQEMGYRTTREELLDYFRSDYFLGHCVLCGVDPRRYFQRYQIDGVNP